MQIHVPENIGGELKLMEGRADSIIDKLILGKSKVGQPKLTVRHIITSELFDDADQTSIGETVLDSMSLQPQAMFRVNNLYKSVTGERIPQGDYSAEEFVAMLEEKLKGEPFSLMLEIETGDDGQERTVVKEFEYTG